MSSRSGMREAGKKGEKHRPRVFLLKYFEADTATSESAGRWRLPLAVDAITVAGVELDWSDASHRPPWTGAAVRRVVRKLEDFGAPFLQTLLAARMIGRSDAVIAVFESQGNFLAALRRARIPPFRRPRFAIVATWLAMDLQRFGAARRALYRWAYRTVDHLIFFSRGQATVFQDVLGMPADRLVFVPFGVDTTYFSPRTGEDAGFVLAVGRDRGRDWKTFFDAVRGTSLAVTVACRPADLRGLDVPPNVTLVGVVSRDEYRDLTARARVVVVPTKVRTYPTGQSVVLESMAMGKCCVVTHTPAISDYLTDGETALLVPPHDPLALRGAIDRALDDAELRGRVGAAARRAVEQRFDAVDMWQAIADVITAPRRATT